ncbi:hypothetical protein [Malaciobacter marinus]|uniref:hypothetical protein n=1 Tax=Malaciobacter marinus TaxID=505249 RepID=UPI003AFFFBD1
MEKQIVELFQYTRNTYYVWKREKRPIIKLIENCFTENELDYFLETGEIPYKIQFANKYFSELNDEFTKYLIDNKGTKALMTTILNEKYTNIAYLSDAIIKQYDENKISSTDLSEYMNNSISEQLLIYILDNKEVDFQLYFSTLKDYQDWLITYFDIIKLSIEKNVYNKIFSNEHEKIYHRAVPKPPKILFFNPRFKISNEKMRNELFTNYKELLNKVKKYLENNTYDELDLYDFFEEYHLEIKPITNHDNDSLLNEDSFSLYQYEANKEIEKKK